MNYHIVYNNFKDYAELFIKNIDFSKANINKVLFLHIGDEEAISEIIENTNFKNAEFYIKDEDSIYDIIETLYSEKVHKFLEYNNMEFDLIIANPPYGSLGNPIISEAIKHLADNGTASVLMPLSCYKKNELYRHVETFELANPKLFKDAAITKNLSICKLNKSKVDNYTWDSLFFSSFDSRYKEFYKWNIDHSIGLSWKGANYKKPEDFKIETDFIDCSRWVNEMKGSGYHPKSGFGYAYNVIGSAHIEKWGSDLAYLRLPSKLAKINFSKYAYNYDNNKRDCLVSKVAAGLFVAHANEEVYMLVPQLDWEHISDTDLWKEGKYDEAVLKEMGLKWDDKKETIIKV